MISLLGYKFTRNNFQDKATAVEQVQKPQQMKQSSLNDLILSTNPSTAPFYYLDKFTSGQMGARNAIKAYAVSSIPFYSYYSIYNKVNNKEVSKDYAMKALFINTLATLS